MTSKQYLYLILKYLVVVIIFFVSFNLYVNDFGLFKNRTSVRIWTDEKTSKYLMSFKYIPNNFDSIIIGSSVSANMDTKKIKNHKVYNLSMNSGNITELKLAVDKIIKNGELKNIIICLYPYLTKNNGVKGRQINEKEYWGSLYSTIPIRMYLRRVKNLIWPGRDAFHSSEWGFNDFNILLKGVDFKKYVVERLSKPTPKIVIDPIALMQLESVISLAHANSINVLAYYYPIYSEYLDGFIESGDWQIYQNSMGELFSNGDIVWDMNAPEYYEITKQHSSYSDGHLSYKGADLVLKEIEKKLLASNKMNGLNRDELNYSDNKMVFK